MNKQITVSELSKLSRDQLEAALARIDAKERKRIKDKNRRFALMSDENKRRAVARDVIQQIEAKRFIAEQGTYLSVTGLKAINLFEKAHEENDDDALETPLDSVLAKAESCHVCGIGSLFVAAVERGDACTLGDMSGHNDDDYLREYLGDFFSDQQLFLIEAAFEGHTVNDAPDGVKSWDTSNATNYVRGIHNENERLLAIMRNIVKNGEFDPRDTSTI
jgi:hypothetical protein